MIEQFTDEELKIIKQELGINQTAGSKKSLLTKEMRDLNKILTGFDEERKFHMVPQSEIWGSMIVLCDYALMNYEKYGKSIRTVGRWRRYSSIFDVPKYKKMMGELIEVFNKYRKESEEKKL